MIGQGSPNKVSRFCKVMITVLVFALAPSYPSELADAQETTSTATTNSRFPARRRSAESIRLRFSWGGGSAQTWTGKISATQGTFSNVVPLGLTADAPAAVKQVNGELLIHHWSSTNYGGVDVLLEGSAETRVIFELTSIENPESRFERSISFDELVKDSIGGDIGLLGNRCSVSRVPGDMIGVEFEREHLVFSPGEPFKFLIRPNLTGLSSRSVNCRVRVVPAHSSGIRVNWSHSTTLSFDLDAAGSAEPQEISLDVPDKESVYNIELELEPIWYQTSLVTKKNEVRRSIQFIVLNDQPLAETGARGWREISTSDPVNPPQESFPSWSQISRLANRATRTVIGNDLRSTVVVDQRSMMQLEPGGWQAIPLTVDRLGKPHVVELEYVSSGEMALGISLLQPDESGQIPLYGFDSGIFIPKSIVTDKSSGSVRRHRLTVWPRSKTPYLLVANRHASLPATVGRVRVFAGPDRLAPSEIAARPNRSARKLMAFYETPLFPENFGAREQMDPSGSQPLDDWRKFYEGADRFIEYLKANSYRGAFITVACDGSSIYPSKYLSSTPKHDNGVFFSNGQDPIRKDVLEMLFRMFEREQLLLIPALALSAPLPEVEKTRKRDGGLSDFELMDLNQIRRQPMIGNSLPIYNPLNRRVQRAVTRVVEELSQRYQAYSSFDGVALICRPDTYALLPGRQWGYDVGTIQQFVQSQPDLGPMPSQWNEIQNILIGSHRTQWIDWRSQQMRLWYEAMANTIRDALPDGKLYLAPVDLYRNDEIASALSPSLHTSSNFEELMRQMGFTKQILNGSGQARDNSIVFLNPHRLAPDQTLSSQRVDLGVEHSRQGKQFFAQASYAGDLFTHRISWAHFEQLQSQSPFGNQESPLMRLQQLTPAEQFNRQRFVQSIKDRDSRMLVDGGWMMSMGQEAAILDLMTVFGQLPDARFSDVVSSKHPSSTTLPLAVRQFQDEHAHYFYIANASPWPIQVMIQLDSNRRFGMPEIESLAHQEFQVRPKVVSPVIAVSQSSGKRQSRYEVSVIVPSYGLVGGRSRDPGFDVTDFQFELPQNADKDLRKRVYLLQSKLIKSINVKPLDVIENSEFEVQGEPSFDGWDTGEQATGNVSLDSDSIASESAKRSGRASLRMTSEGQNPVWVRSNTFAAPETGRLSISVWLRTDDVAEQPPLRLAVEGQSNGSSYYRFGSVGSLSTDENANQLETRWKRFAVHFDDLPIGEMKDLRIGFDLMGPGQVSIDNVQVFDRWFDENDAKAITQMLASTAPLLTRPESFDSCRRILEGYWTRFLDQYVDTEVPPIVRPSNVPRPDSSQIANSQNLESGSYPTNKQVDEEPKKVSKFRRFRGFGPQRKSPLP